MLVRAMQSNDSPWELVHFVGSQEAITLAQELQVGLKAPA